MKNDMDLLKKQLKGNIQELIDSGDLKDARPLVEQYKDIDSDDVEAYSMNAVILMMENKFDEAEKVLREGLDIDENNFDLNYNLGYVYEQKKNFKQALWYYNKALHNCDDENVVKEINQVMEKIQREHNITTVENKKKIAFICLKGLDNFIDDIIKKLSDYYIVKKFIIAEEKNVYKAIDWTDVVWLEWGNQSTILATNYSGIKNKKVIVRIHGYEVFSDMPTKINWSVVDKLIFVAEHKRNIFYKQFGNVIEKNKTCILRNGININKYTIDSNKKKNKNIAFVGNINYRKGIEMLIQFFYELLQIDSEYKLYIRGYYQDLRYKLAIETMIDELGIRDSIIFVERVNDLNKWFSNMTYVVSSSIEESFHYTIGEGMLAGLKPIIHAWKESRDIWPKEYIFKNRKEFLNIILNEKYEPDKYRKFVVDNYSLEKQVNKIETLLNILNKKGIQKENKNEQITLNVIMNSFNEFIPYRKAYLDTYDFKSYKILIGKKEKINDRYRIYECIIENSEGKKLILNNIWYDYKNNHVILPDIYEKTSNLKFILKIVNEIKKINIDNNMGGFILDKKIRQDVEQNYLAYNWERGIQGTQFMPSIRYLFIIERYKFIGKFIDKNDIVLEAAPGFGYGAAYLSTLCRQLDALDIAKENIEFGKSIYDFENLNWVEGDVTKLPYDRDTFDVYVSCETIEHLPLDLINKYLEEAIRVLKKNGKMIITTPNRLTRENVHNPYHIKEYTFNELKEILSKYFKMVVFYSAKGCKIDKGNDNMADGIIAVCH
ncbi:methyltransferase domain-containing protein [Clostridium autoethanogenum]|nr:methyltransferase domain-containing protein [Clostridium autoethanogenum]